ncbi:MAG: hypothetical protein DMD46_09740 [Gemmatimonadetes bacterium]|nr:MAG: hypothetical protein DMD46_09740 [Gemmatimonadota bacterium]
MKATRVVLVVALLGCGDRVPTSVTPRASGFDQPSLVADPGLVRCTPLPPDSATQTIGPLGGVIQVGQYRLSIPAGALDAPVVITAVAPADTVNRVQLEPQGLTFDQPASLAMSYANCSGLASLLPKRIAYTSDELVILALLPSVDDVVTRTVTGRLEHFSDYAIAW